MKKTNEDLLNLYPVQACEYEEDENDLVVVHYVNKNPSFIERIFFKKQIKRPAKIELDEIGSFVWKLCNGKNCVRDIMENAVAEFGEKIEPAEERMKTFINQMAGNKFIVLYQKTVK